MTSIRKALLERQTSLTMNEEELIVNHSTMLFLVSYKNNFQIIPQVFNESFRVVMFNSPDIKVLLKVGLVQNGFTDCDEIVSNISEFLDKLQGIFHAFSSGFKYQKLQSFLNSSMRSYKDLVSLEKEKKDFPEQDPVEDTASEEEDLDITLTEAVLKKVIGK